MAKPEMSVYIPYLLLIRWGNVFFSETRGERTRMPGRGAIVTPATLRFFRELKRNNRKEWMDANRDRYRAELVEPMRALLADLAPHALELHPGFDTAGRTGVNLSRINRDIRFAK